MDVVGTECIRQSDLYITFADFGAAVRPTFARALLPWQSIVIMSHADYGKLAAWSD